MLYALFCHQLKSDCNKFRSDVFSILFRISYLWHPVTFSCKIKTNKRIWLYFNTSDGTMQERCHKPDIFKRRYFWDPHASQAGQGWPHWLFLPGKRLRKMLVGELPNKRDSGTKYPKIPALCACCLRPVAVAPGPYCFLVCAAKETLTAFIKNRNKP